MVAGRYLLAGTFKCRHPIYRDFAGTIFYDRGGVGDKWHEFKTVAGSGAGVRRRTPLYGEAVKRFRFHFSIGHSF